MVACGRPGARACEEKASQGLNRREVRPSRCSHGRFISRQCPSSFRLCPASWAKLSRDVSAGRLDSQDVAAASDLCGHSARKSVLGVQLAVATSPDTPVTPAPLRNGIETPLSCAPASEPPGKPFRRPPAQIAGPRWGCAPHLAAVASAAGVTQPPQVQVRRFLEDKVEPRPSQHFAVLHFDAGLTPDSAMQVSGTCSTTRPVRR